MATLVINTKFYIGQSVYLVTDVNQQERIVVGIMIDVGNVLMYRVSYMNTVDNFYDFELTNYKNQLKSIL